MPPPEPRPGARVFDALLLALGLFLLVQAYGIAGFSKLSSPGALPLAAAAVMVAAAATAALTRGRGGAEPLAELRRRLLPGPVLAMAVLIAALAAALERLGFLIAAPAFLVLAFLALDRRRPGRKLAVAVAAVAVLYVLFRLVFQVLLPEGIVPERAILAWLEDLFGARP